MGAKRLEVEPPAENSPNVDPVQTLFRQLLDGHGFTSKRQRFARGAGRCEQSQLGQGKLRRSRTPQQLDPDGARGPGDGDDGRR